MAQSSIIYTAGEGSAESIKSKIDQIYDKAGVPKNERIYALDGSQDEYQGFHDKFHKYFFEPYPKGNFAGENGQAEREVFKEAHLAQSRLWLGLTILSDIKEDGWCEITAEL